jgi:hypothetical protein
MLNLESSSSQYKKSLLEITNLSYIIDAEQNKYTHTRLPHYCAKLTINKKKRNELFQDLV